MKAAKILQHIFGVQFTQVEDILSLRQYSCNNAYCTSEEGAISGIFSSENTYEKIIFDRDFPALEYLNLSDNKNLSSVLFEGSFPKLKHIDISDCALESIKIPQGFFALEWLDVSRNQINSPAHFVEPLARLKHLDLSDNEMGFPISTMEKLPALERIYLKNNPLSDEKIGGVAQYANCIVFLKNFYKDYYDERYYNDPTIKHEFKVIVVGNGGVGKSCFVERLVKGTFTDKHLSTDGVVLERYSKGPNILNIWDFAGQDIYHSTHRLFMQSNAIYLLMWNQAIESQTSSAIGDKEYENYSLAYWLHYIRQDGNTSPIIVVKTRSLENNLDHEDQNQLKKEYEVTAFEQIDSYNNNPERGEGYRFSNLLETIYDAIERKLTKPELPASWNVLRRYLRQLYKEEGKKVLSYADFEDIVEAFELNVSVEEVLSWLSNSGVVYHRKGYFGNAIMLDQQWAIDPVYAILRRTGDDYWKFSLYKKGKLSGQDLIRVWNKVGNYSRAEQELFLQFMISCDLCFELDKEKNQDLLFEERYFIFPSLFPKLQKKIQDHWFFRTHRKQEKLYVRYSHLFLHDGIIQQFIIRAQELAIPEDLWAYGAVLDNGEDSFAMVYSEKKVPLSGQGGIRGYIYVVVPRSNPALLHKIRNTLTEIQGGAIKEFVSVDGEAWVNLEKLIKVKNKKGKEIEAENHEMVEKASLEIFLDNEKEVSFKVRLDTEQVNAAIEKHENLLQKKKGIPELTFRFENTPIKLLILQANPTMVELEWEKEHSLISESLSDVFPTNDFITIPKSGRSYNQMLNDIEDHEPQILHFIGHGEKGKRGGFQFHRISKAHGELVRPAQFKQAFKGLKEAYPMLQLVFLNACYTEMLALEISKAGIICIGANAEVDDEACRLVAAGFYRSLFKKKNLLRSLKVAIDTRGTQYDPDMPQKIKLYHNGQEIPLQ